MTTASSNNLVLRSRSPRVFSAEPKLFCVIAHFSGADGNAAACETHAYPFAGCKNAAVKLGVLDVAAAMAGGMSS